MIVQKLILMKMCNKMSRVDFLISETGVVASLWKQYIDRTKKCIRDELKIQYYCFYEGKDDCKYYNTIFNSKLIEIQHFDCKGKYKLLEFKNFMDSKYNNPINVIYFIDKDFDDKIKEEEYLNLKLDKKIYITPCYSIENFYTIEEVFKKIIINEYGYTICCPEYRELLTMFIHLRTEYHNKIRDINYWYATYRYFEEKKIILDKLSLSGINISKYLDINKDLNQVIVRKNLLDFLKNQLTEIPDNFNDKYEEIKNKFANNCCDFRGKFELYFLERFILRVRENGKYNNFNVDNSNILSNLSQYAMKPQCLDEFLSSQIV
jgi:hypothetical protein